MRQHFDRAIELSKGKRAGTYVSFAENACLPAQNAAEFKSMLEKALAVDPDADPDHRLANSGGAAPRALAAGACRRAV
jgi:predicted anti-sigma-YlaC factor YlaD